MGVPGTAGGFAFPDTVADADYFNSFPAPYHSPKLSEINQNVKA